MGEKIIGIDLGTTNSVVSVVVGGEPVVIQNQEGNRITPSVVSWTKEKEILVGEPAKRRAILDPLNTVYESKRFIGRKYDEVKDIINRVSYKVVADEKGDAAFDIPNAGKIVRPEEVGAHILRKLKEAAEAYLGEEVKKAVITVPAYFNERQRQATKMAGKLAGLEVVRVLNEPTAAALAYGLDKKENAKILVYDFGGGTFDVSILEGGEGVIEVKATAGDPFLGGANIDERIMDWLIEEFKKETGIDLRQDKTALQRLKEAAEQAKKELSFKMETEISLPFITIDPETKQPLHLQKKLTRARLEQMIEDIVDRTMEIVKKALDDAKLKPEDIDDVVLVGGSTRIPLVQKKIKEFFGKEPHKGVNPDEVVAVGAAIQGSVLSGEKKDVLLIDVTPLSLGIETYGGAMTVLIPRNTPIPVKKCETFTTVQDYQTEVEIKVIGEDGKERTLHAKLTKYPEQMLAQLGGGGETEVEQGKVSWLGMTVVDVKSDDARKLGIKADKGVVVIDVDPSGKASDAGIQVGDIILKVGKIEINNLSDFSKAKDVYKDSKKPIILKLSRRGIPRFIAITPK